MRLQQRTPRMSISTKIKMFAVPLFAVAMLLEQGFKLQLSGYIPKDNIPDVLKKTENTSTSDDNSAVEILTIPMVRQSHNKSYAWFLNNKTEISDISYSSIPKVINKIFIQHSGMMMYPSDMTPTLIEAHQSWTTMNPGYQLQYFDLSNCREYLKTHFHPIFSRAFDCLQPYAAKADLFRAAVVFREGGWYSDWKQQCLEDGLLDNLSSIGDNLVLFQGDPRYKRVQNALFGATPRHPMLAEVLKTILINVQSSNYDNNAWDTSSTGLFYRKFHELAKENMTSIEQNLVGKFALEKSWAYFVKGKKVALHTCNGCSSSNLRAHSWEKGNNYVDMFRGRQWYCPHAASLFELQ
mmetsp:Transcript_14402/g.16484  ORF Transcript_14402/g.16484 Transcript_14402/m.16484 type:complete len:352 (+) Transcript_14402:71-1126(+)|eukprot:CAMPEP_0170907542 /NCGR_PEP_ID=MMETSP0735-20130129/1381_1 /TAXON_ID=186038 /ORGANISM="Fragilariopsis kerguelensis, Strain L26-C5" /LENGTH=351 /DNA_ID=CAMNT_0011303713 /DNA_START=55 /DNA_END=1110 /DNA_ORIENTATION=-